MTSVSRSAQFAKLAKVLKKYYKPSSHNAGRTVLEHLLFACCLEDAHRDAAEEAFAALVHTFFDWNEVRVTSIAELSEVMARLPDSRSAANRVKRILHAVFESTFNFDLEDWKKKNLGPTVTALEKLDGSSRFVVAVVVQAALGGHSIPIDGGTMAVLRILDLVSDEDASSGVVPGLERAIAKPKGVEFASMLHELGADYSANPFSPQLRDILLQIDPACKDRMPKRRVERPARKEPEPETAEEKPAKATKSSAKPAGNAASSPKGKSTEPAAKSDKPQKAEKPAKGDTHEKSEKAAKVEKGEKADKLAARKKPAEQPAAPPSSPAKKKAEPEREQRKSEPPKKRPASEGLAKRKPR